MRDALERQRRREGGRRLKVITIARTIALLVIAGIVAIVSPPQTLTYYYTLITLSAVIGWVGLAVSRSRLDGPWRDYAFVAADFALITFTLIVPAPGAPEDLPAAFYLRFDNFDYFYVILCGVAISLRPLLLFWSGLCGAVFWSVGLWWVSLEPGVYWGEAPAGPERIPELLRLAGDPYHVDLGVEFQGVAIFLIASTLLAVVVEASRRLFIAQAAEERRAANLSRYLPAEMIETLADRDAPFGEETETEAAVLFTDIVGFSHLAEHREPREVIGILRDVHRIVGEQVFTAGGMLDKFIGDGAMATFGAARREGNGGDHPARRAIRCAEAIIAAIDAWSDAREGPEVRISVGVHYGPVVVGDVGSDRRMELAVIGDAVNVAARLEHITRELGVAGAVSEEAMEAAGWPDGPVKIGGQSVHGREAPVDVWGLSRG